jgi:hypothetical protein
MARLTFSGCAGIASEVINASNLENYDGSIREVQVEIKGKQSDPVLIGIGGCAVTADGEPMKLSSMLKVHLVAELQVQSQFTGDIASLLT